MKKKECPSCAMEIDKNVKNCPVCGYEFTQPNPLIKWIAILLAILLLYLTLS